MEDKWIFLLIINIDRTLTNFVGTSSKWRNRVLHHFSPLSQWQDYNEMASLGRETWCAPKGQRDAESSITSEATMDYSFLALNFLLLQCIQEAQYIALQRGNGGSNPSDLEAYGMPRVKWFGNTSRKTPKIFGLMHTSRCTQV